MINLAKVTPMMRQYLDLKARHEDALVFFRLGDFYEMFFEDAEIVSRELDLVLTGRDCGLEKRAPMCGVPHHAIDNYISRLIDKGYKVALAEQTTEPGPGVKLVERDVVKIVTPGTITDTNMLDEGENNFLASVYYEDSSVGIAWTDITTGEMNYAEFYSPFSQKLNDVLSRIRPREVICNNEMLAVSVELSVVKFGGVSAFSTFNDDEFVYENALCNIAFLKETSQVDLKNKKLATSALGALIAYISKTQKKVLDHLNIAQDDNKNKYLELDSIATKTLELLENSSDGKKKGTLLWLIDKTVTPMGKRFIKSQISRPLMCSKSINERLDGVEVLTDNILRDKLSGHLKNIFDIERLMSKVSNGNIGPRELLSLNVSLNELKNLKIILNGISTKILSSIAKMLNEFKREVVLINSSIDIECPNKLSLGRVIKKGFDKELDEYMALSDNIASHLAELELKERAETGIKTLKIGYTRVYGYFIEVSKAYLGQVPYRFVRKQTVAGGERFFTEELKELEDKILSAKDKASKREEQLYCEIVQKIKEKLDEILSSAKAIAHLDFLCSSAQVATEYNFIRPKIDSKIQHIRIKEGRHGVIEKLLKNDSFVPNDTFLDGGENKLMLITGPNMAGKSVYMRQVALIAVLAHMGSFVPASECEMCVLDRIFTRVGAHDDFLSGRSTFMVEMSEVANILSSATSSSLVIMDEVGRGTSTYDGLSIAKSILEYLSKKLKAKALFSTHYHELTELEGNLSGIKNYKLTLKEVGNQIIFMRKLARGASNRSFGVEVARLAGLPQDVTNRAKEILIELENREQMKIQQMSFDSIEKQVATQKSEVERILKDIDLNNLTPLQALDVLADLKEKLK
ncbi:MAG: DNA mismatch repair protein MutS [Firmicutes bacterium]|nr:DNA mismatch repair protein MutS [Bacillota bacterium]